MTSPAPPPPSGLRAGVLLVRVWIEGRDRETLRARITQLPDVTRLERSVTVVATVEEIHAALGAWLSVFVEPG